MLHLVLTALKGLASGCCSVADVWHSPRCTPGPHAMHTVRRLLVHNTASLICYMRECLDVLGNCKASAEPLGYRFSHPLP